MKVSELLDRSERFASDIFEFVAELQTQAAPDRARAAADEALMSLEHWRSVGTLLLQRNIPSALVVQLEQLDAATRSLWLRHVASAEQLNEFFSYQSLAWDQVRPPGLPSISDMQARIKERAPINQYYIVSEAREARWTYSRKELYHDWRKPQVAEGLGSAMLYNSNAVGALVCFQVVDQLGGSSQKEQLRAVIARHPGVISPSQSERLLAP